MGYSKLTYDDYMSNYEYWIEQGVMVPKWAEELSGKGYESVCAIDFYDDVFGEDLEEHRMPEDYRTGEYGAIAVEQIPYKKDGKDLVRGRRTTVTKGNMELYDLIERSERFCMIAPISYAGKRRTNANARFMYALCIEVDNIKEKTGLNELIYSWERRVSTMPKPTYIVCSGNGVHLYFVFERPIPLFRNVFEQMGEAKKYWTRIFWSSYVTYSNKESEVQYESINQPFRCVGTVAKDGKAYAMAFKIGEKVTIEYLNDFLPEELKINVVYKRNLPLEEAKEKYPNWYKRRIEEGKERGHWNRYEGIYYDWIEKMRQGAKVGHRYNCLENLCSLAVQCNIAPEQVEKDCRELAVMLEEQTVEEGNHFTEYDILCALKTYHEASEGAYRRRIEFISAKTGIPLTPNKRNGRKQKDHVIVMNKMKEVKRVLGEQINEGRPQKLEIVYQWRIENPNGTKAECIRETGLSKPTVYKWWSEQPDYSFFIASDFKQRLGRVNRISKGD